MGECGRLEMVEFDVNYLCFRYLFGSFDANEVEALSEGEEDDDLNGNDSEADGKLCHISSIFSYNKICFDCISVY